MKRTTTWKASAAAVVLIAVSVALMACDGNGLTTRTETAPELAVSYMPTTLRFETEQSAFPEYASLEAAAPEFAFKPKTPKARVGSLKKVVVRNQRGGSALPKAERSVDLHYDDVMIIEYPYESADQAQREFSWFQPAKDSAEYYSKVDIAGHSAWVKQPINRPLIEDANGVVIQTGTSSPGSSVLWVDDNMLYNVSSQTLSTAELVVVAQSMYQ